MTTNAIDTDSTISISAATFTDFFTQNNLGFAFEEGAPIDGRPQIFGKSEIFPTAMIQLIGDPGSLHAASATAVLGPYPKMNEGAVMVVITLAALADRPHASDWVRRMWLSLGKDKYRKERTFERVIGNRLYQCIYVREENVARFECRITAAP